MESQSLVLRYMALVSVVALAVVVVLGAGGMVCLAYTGHATPPELERLVAAATGALSAVVGQLVQGMRHTNGHTTRRPPRRSPGGPDALGPSS